MVASTPTGASSSERCVAGIVGMSSVPFNALNHETFDSSSETTRSSGAASVLVVVGHIAALHQSFGFVQTHDTEPKRRLFEVLRPQGPQMNQEGVFFTDSRGRDRRAGERAGPALGRGSARPP